MVILVMNTSIYHHSRISLVVLLLIEISLPIIMANYILCDCIAVLKKARRPRPAHGRGVGAADGKFILAI